MEKTTLEEFLSGVLMAVLFLSAIFQVFNRFLFHLSAPWTEELCRYSFIWLALLGISNGIKRNTHLNVDLIDYILPAKAKEILNVVLDVLFLALMIYMFRVSIPYVSKTMQYGTTSVGLHIKMWIIYLILPVFSGLPIYRLIERYVLRLLRKNKGEVGEEEKTE